VNQTSNEVETMWCPQWNIQHISAF